MLKGCSVIIVAVMAHFWVKSKPQFKHHWISLIAIFLGVVLVGLSSTIFSDGMGEETKPLGIVLLFCSQIFHGLLFISEERILGEYYLDPLYVVGCEGLYGCLTWVVLLPI